MKKYLRSICVVLAILCLCACAVSCNSSTDNGKNDGESTKFYVEYKDTKITLGAPADSIIAALGQAQNRVEIGDCGGLGAQVKYSYPSVDVYVLESKEDGSVIDQISFKDDVISTPEGVFIGMEVSKAKGILGTPDKESDKSMEYGDGKYALVIGFADGKVNRIDYLS